MDQTIDSILGHFKLFRFASVLVIATSLVPHGSAQESTSARDRDTTSLYLEEVKPVLKERCFACHGALKQEASLRLDTGTFVRKGSENGSILNFQEVDQSALLRRLRADDESIRMPPIGKPLTAKQIDAIREWVTQKAVSPAGENPEPSPQEHWAFKRPVRYQVPNVDGNQWARNSVDHFVFAQLKARGLTPAADATPEQLIRRVYLDLIGLPPTVNQLNEFVLDPSEDTYGKIVDRLLDSPQYGERWARHWMDVWRYSDWYGRRSVNDVRNSAPQIWRWRDWIVNSLNSDKGYDRMIHEMLAADEIAPEDDSAWPATGYLIRNYYSLNPNEWMRFNVEYTGKAFLGLTFNCAHCHDHKYDPIAHEDYFRFRAFFEPLGIRQDRVLGEEEPPPFSEYQYGGSRKVVRLGMVRVFDKNADAPTWFYTGGDERNKVKERGSIAAGVPGFLGVPLPKIESFELPMSGWYPGSRKNIQAAELKAARERLEVAKLSQLDPVDVDAELALAAKSIKQARAEIDRELAKPDGSSTSHAIEARQSLYLDAAQGRRIIQNTLPEVKELHEGITISFQLKIIQDKHFNFQLARNTQTGHTALYLGFVEGKIKGYRPGGFAPFVLGNYPTVVDKSKSRQASIFEIKLKLNLKQDTATVLVRQVGSGQALVDGVDIALNGWNPTKNPHQPITFDCRSGTRALIDSVAIKNGDQSLKWRFEGPKFMAGDDVAGIDGWVIHRESLAPATSTVSMFVGNSTMQASFDRWRKSQEVLGGLSKASQLGSLEVKAAETALQATRATIQADNAKRNRLGETEIDPLARAAYRKQLEAKASDARWREAKHAVSLAKLRLVSMNPQAGGDTKEKAAAAKKLNAEITATSKSLNVAIADYREVENQLSMNPNSTKYELLSPTSSRTSTGRRRSLAMWITDKRNPLTARVAINHIWMRHFRQPLVASVTDFGRNGKEPTHPKLLDWLATELHQQGWKMKPIHRLIVTSRVYRMSSRIGRNEAVRKNLVIDQDNQHLWRMNAGRMEAEVIRDSILNIAGTLNKELGGPVLSNTQAMTTFRRSLYYEVFPEDGGNIKMATIFDAPDPGECFRRTSTIVPQQALALSNAKMIHDASFEVATQLQDVQHAEFVNLAFQTVLSRRPNQKERLASIAFLKKQSRLIKDDRLLKASLIRVLFNHNDFVAIQ